MKRIPTKLRAKRKRVKTHQKPFGYWNDFVNVKRELFAFISEHGTTGVMPTQNELQKAGHRVLALAINKHGGLMVVAKRLGLKRLNTDKPKGYLFTGFWSDSCTANR